MALLPSIKIGKTPYPSSLLRKSDPLLHTPYFLLPNYGHATALGRPLQQ